VNSPPLSTCILAKARHRILAVAQRHKSSPRPSPFTTPASASTNETNCNERNYSGSASEPNRDQTKEEATQRPETGPNPHQVQLRLIPGSPAATAATLWPTAQLLQQVPAVLVVLQDQAALAPRGVAPTLLAGDTPLARDHMFGGMFGGDAAVDRASRQSPRPDYDNLRTPNANQTAVRITSA